MDCNKLYVGDVSSSASKEDLEEEFSAYGRLRNVWVARNPPGFAFIEYEDRRDAEDAVRALDGRTICGKRIRVEMSRGKSQSRQRDRGPPPRRGRPFNTSDRCYECGERGHYARDCNRYSRQSRNSRSRSRTRSPRRRSRSRSQNRDGSPSGRRSRSASRDRSRSRNRSPSPRRERSRSMSRSPRENGNRRDED